MELWIAGILKLEYQLNRHKIAPNPKREEEEE